MGDTREWGGGSLFLKHFSHDNPQQIICFWKIQTISRNIAKPFFPNFDFLASRRAVLNWVGLGGMEKNEKTKSVLDFPETYRMDTWGHYFIE